MFKTRAEQLVYFFCEFLEFIGELFPEDTRKDILMVRSAPPSILIAKALDMLSRYKEGLTNRDLNTIFKIVLEQSPQTHSYEETTKQVLEVMNRLETDVELRDDFWEYVKVLQTVADV